MFSKVCNLYKRGEYIYKREGFKTLFKKAWNFYRDVIFTFIHRLNLIDKIFLSISLKRLRSLMEKENSLTDIIETPYNFRGLGIYRTIKPVQDKEELLLFLKTISENSPKVIVEIGTAFGGTLYCIARSIKDLRKVISIDMDDRFYDLGYFLIRKKLLKKFMKNGEIHFLIGNSHDINIETELINILDGEKIDVLFIDGDHSYEGTKDDFERYSKYIAPNGIIAFHDIVESKFSRDPAVCYRDIKEKYNYLRYKEIIANKEQVSGGIGLMYWS